MNISNFTNKCLFDNPYEKNTFNPIISSGISVISSNSDDDCINLQTLYNIVTSQGRGDGSSYSYTSASHDDDEDDIRKKRVERFESKNRKINYLFIFIILIILIIVKTNCT